VNEPVNPYARAWVPLARHALTLAIENELRTAAQVTQRMFDEHGEACMVPAMLSWIDTMLAAQHPGTTPGAHGVALVFRAEGTGKPSSADEVSAEVAWAGRLISARAAGDLAMFGGLVSTIPVHAHGRYVMVLLSTVATTLRTVGGGEST
jgi:hypothetical protein